MCLLAGSISTPAAQQRKSTALSSAAHLVGVDAVVSEIGELILALCDFGLKRQSRPFWRFECKMRDS